MSVDEMKRSRRGPESLDATTRRDHCVSVRLNLDELSRLDEQRALVGMQRGEYLRAASLHQLPPTIPAINREAWVELSRAASNLNQLAKAHNEGDALNPEHLRQGLAGFRAALIGAGGEL